MTDKGPTAFPSGEETRKHHAYPATIWALEPDRKGKAAVAEGRGGPINIAWEIHGSGPMKIVVSSSYLRAMRQS